MLYLIVKYIENCGELDMSKWIKFTLGRSNEGGKQLILRNCLVNGQ